MIFKDKGILITGASRGLGMVCAKELSRQGAKLVLLARSVEKLEETRSACLKPKRHFCIAVDLTDMQELQRSIVQAKDFLEGIDVVLHVAGGGLGLKDNLINADDFLKLFILNVIVASQINRLVIPDMLKKKRGRLVHVASIASAEVTGSVGYNTVKAALAAYVRSLGRELASSGIVATGILPGGFYAPGNSWERFMARDPKAVKRFIKERLPRGFLAKAEELIPMILLLCSDSASMMGGCLVPIDAGEGRSYLTND